MDTQHNFAVLSLKDIILLVFLKEALELHSNAGIVGQPAVSNPAFFACEC